MFRNFNEHKYLLSVLIKRDVNDNFHGSMLGFVWLLLQPLLMLLLYTFVFGMVYKTTWPGMSDSKIEFAMTLFAGLATFNIFADSVTKCPTLISSNANFVNKVNFPLHLLVLVKVVSALYTALASFSILLVAGYIFNETIYITSLLLPLILLPVVLFTLGIGWFFASIGVYFRDVNQLLGVFVTLLLFMSPVFFPPTAVPEEFRGVLALNPFTIPVNQVREVLLHGVIPDFMDYLFLMGSSAIVCVLGICWFNLTRDGFTDVV